MPFFAYLITDGRYGCETPAAFAAKLESIFEKHRPQYALYRDKDNPDYTPFAAAFVNVCHLYGIEAMLHRDTALALTLGADGVHLTSTQFDEIRRAKTAGLHTVVSTHTPVEIMHAAADGADAVTYSPIFDSPGKGEPLGVNTLKEVVVLSDIDIIALGGIVTEEQIEGVRQSGAAGFASIRYFDTAD